MENKLVSVIIPTYNRKSFISESVESVLNQTYQNFELIVVDDHSTDGTGEVLRRYGDKLTLIRQAHKGPAAARNTGIRAAAGEWLAFLDSDDLWLPRKLETQMTFVKNNPEVRICYTEEIWYRKGRRVNPAKRHRKYSGWIYRKMLPLCLVSPSSVLIHRSVFESVGLFDELLLACEDYDLWLRVGAVYPIYLIDQPLIIKRNGHAEQQSQRYWGMDRFRIYALRKMLLNGHLNPEDRQATLETLKTKCEIVAAGCEKRGKIEEAAYYRSLARIG